MNEQSSQDLTDLLIAWSAGRQDALDRLTLFVHHDLLGAVRRYLARKRRRRFLQPPVLVNEAYVRLVDVRRIRWQDRADFLALGAGVIRRVLVGFARAQPSRQRGGALERICFDEALIVSERRLYDLLVLDQALDYLATAERAQIVEVRVFGGSTIGETAAALRLTADTVLREWKRAKAWLAPEVGGDHRK
jgi:RNA polymerase sigma factor (TIGR02999 family)